MKILGMLRYIQSYKLLQIHLAISMRNKFPSKFVFNEYLDVLTNDNVLFSLFIALAKP